MLQQRLGRDWIYLYDPSTPTLHDGEVDVDVSPRKCWAVMWLSLPYPMAAETQRDGPSSDDSYSARGTDSLPERYMSVQQLRAPRIYDTFQRE